MRELYFSQLRTKREDDLAHYKEVYGWDQGVGGNKTKHWKAREEKQRDRSIVGRELAGELPIEDDDEE
jgi:hypothetical protein